MKTVEVKVTIGNNIEGFKEQMTANAKELYDKVISLYKEDKLIDGDNEVEVAGVAYLVQLQKDKFTINITDILD